MEKPNDEPMLSFNIYYLNFSKVYEISMMINNVRASTIQREKNHSREMSKTRKGSVSADLGSKAYLADIKSVIETELSVKNTNSSKMIETLDVKTTKSVLLREIVGKCKAVCSINNYAEGDLVKIDRASLSLLDEENVRQILLLRRDALKGLRVEGFEINNLFSSMLHDYSYILKGKLDNSNDLIVIKIPMEIENEFESKYSVDDLFIGHVSIIGIYKGAVTEEFIKTNTVSFFSSQMTPNQVIEKKVFPSRVSEQPSQHGEQDNISCSKDKEAKLHFVDVIALVQDVKFKPFDKVEIILPWYRKILNLIFRRG